jgi:hypothetical protein
MQHAAAPFFLIKGELRPPLDPPTGGVNLTRPQRGDPKRDRVPL